MFGIGIKTKLKPGLICVPTSEQGRYNEFNFCLAQLRKPKGTIVDWQIGDDRIFLINQSIKHAISKNLDWIWILDDTCAFDPGILFRLLKNYKQVVFPFLLERAQPYRPTLKQPIDGGYMQFGMEHFKDETGLIPLNGLCLDISGILIKTSVLRKMQEPWMENEHRVNMDYGLYFCKKLSEIDADTYLDLDNSMGHMTHIQVIPHRTAEGQWVSVYQSFNKLMYQEHVTPKGDSHGRDEGINASRAKKRRQ